ncbi:MAG: hypothetical protein JNM24_12120 [Bdellovibrionaceae bacterium]|nr:hypothetical protein [Pseudobdellovibrionaceae bacterium]
MKLAFLIISLYAVNLSAFCEFFNFEDLQELAEDSALSAQLIQFQKNPKDFCDQQLALRYLGSPDRNNEMKTSKLEIERAVSDNSVQELTRTTYLKNDKLMNGYDNWNRTLIPLEESKLDITKNIDINDPESKSKDKIDLDRALVLLSKNSPCMEIYYVDCNRNFEKRTILSIDPKQKKFACYELLGLLKINSCDKDFDSISKIATPVSNVTARDILKQVMSDSRYNEGLRLAAIKIAKRTKKSITKSSNLFDDLKESFLESGANEVTAEEMTWNTLAVLSASGANLWQRLISVPYSYDQGQKRLAFHTIAASLPILDHRSSSTGHIYSFPKEVSGFCNSGKSYHFWYTAFLARHATIENGNPESAMVAAYQAQKFYQLKRGKIGNGNVDSSINSNLNSPSSNVTRIDLAYASTGAIYGAQKATTQIPSNQNLDYVFESLMLTSGKGSPSVLVNAAAWTMEKPFSSYPHWVKKYNPNETLKNKPAFTGSVKKEFLEFKKNPQKLSCSKQQKYDCN